MHGNLNKSCMCAMHKAIGVIAGFRICCVLLLHGSTEPPGNWSVRCSCAWEPDSVAHALIGPLLETVMPDRRLLDSDNKLCLLDFIHGKAAVPLPAGFHPW